MRILFTCVPGFGHFHPLVPLASAAEDAGHEVAFTTAERFCRRVVEPAGFRWFAAGLSPMVVHEQTLGLPAVAGLADGEVWRFGAHMFAEVAAPAKVAELVGIIRDWGCDLVVHDMTDFSGPIAAAVCGIVAVNHSFGAMQPDEFWDVAAAAVAPTWEAWGLAPRPLGGMFDTLFLDIAPLGFQSAMIERVPAVQSLRPVPFDNPLRQPLPPWFSALAPGPKVYVTLGTVANHTPHVFETVLAGVADQPATVIMTVGPDRDPAELGPLPANVHVEAYLPQTLVFPTCDLVVCHGGSGTTLAALAAGLPLLLLPQEANQFWNAERVAALGAGQVLRSDQLSAEAVQRAVGQLLADPSPRATAQAIAADIAAMPGPDQVVATLELLVGAPA